MCKAAQSVKSKHNNGFISIVLLKRENGQYISGIDSS